MEEDELNGMDPFDTPFTVPLIKGDAATIKLLANNKSAENPGL